MKSKKRIAVVGAGISGLTAAYRFHQMSHEIHVYEKSPRIGGIIQTEKKNGFILEKGPDGFLQQKPVMQKLAEEIGIGSQLITTKKQNRRSMMLQNNRLVAVPDGFYLMSPSKIFPFLMSPLLSIRGKIRTLAEIFVPPKKNTADESLASFVRRRFGSENLEKISQAMLGGIYTADPEKLSMRSALPRFVDMEQKYGSITRGLLKTMKDQKSVSGARYGLFGSFHEGMQTLTDMLAQKIGASSIHMNSNVEQIRWVPQNKSWILRCNDQEESFDEVCLAIPPHRFSNMVAGITDHEKEDLQSIRYASSVIFHFGFKSSQIRNKPRSVGFIVPQKENKHFIACSFISDKYENRAPEGYDLLRVFSGGALQEKLLELPTNELKNRILEELRTIIDIEGDPILEDVAIWPHSMPQYTLGHTERVHQIRTIMKKFPNLHLLGNAYQGVGIPDLVEQTQIITKN